MAKGTLLYFVSDLHGSASASGSSSTPPACTSPTVLVLGGDVAGKAIQSIVKGPNGRGNCTFVGNRYELTEGAELAELERLIADHGYYPYRAEPGELEAMEADGTLDDLFYRLMRDRLAEWLDIADTRLRPQGVPLYLMLGKRRPAGARREMLDRAPWGVHAEGKVVQLDDEHEMISWGYANTTPWHTYREQDEQQLASRLRCHGGPARTPERAVSTCTRRRMRPSWTTRPPSTTTSGSRRCWARSSTRRSAAPRCATSSRTPAAGRAARPHSRVLRHPPPGQAPGRDPQPGSDYSTGALNGALVSLHKDRADASWSAVRRGYAGRRICRARTC